MPELVVDRDVLGEQRVPRQLVVVLRDVVQVDAAFPPLVVQVHDPAPMFQQRLERAQVFEVRVLAVHKHAGLHDPHLQGHSRVTLVSDSVSLPDDKVRRYLVYLKYWTLNPRPLMVYPKVLFPPNFIINSASLPFQQTRCAHMNVHLTLQAEQCARQ